MQPDVTLTLDRTGVIQDAVLSNGVAAEDIGVWRGQPWTETVDESVRGKVERMLSEARMHGVAAFRQLDQRFPSGLAVPMEYTAVRLDGQGGLIAIGRNLQTIAELQSRLIAVQQAMEQEYWKLREVETRYRLLFDASNEAVLTLRADGLRVIEANPAAIRLLGLARESELLTEIAAEDRDPVQHMLRRVQQAGRAPGILVHLGPAKAPWLMRASSMPGERGPLFLVQLAPAEPGQVNALAQSPASLDDFVDRLPDGLVVIDREGFIRRANRAFLDLIQVAGEPVAIGESLGRWLSQPGADLGVLLANLHHHGAVRLFGTTIHGELGGVAQVEISAVGNTASRPGQIALVVRDTSRRLSFRPESNDLKAAVAALIAEAGDSPLRSLVKDTVGLVERHYILAALDLTRGNRTTAAEMLGLSRQGFYKKLAQYSIDGHDSSDK